MRHYPFKFFASDQEIKRFKLKIVVFKRVDQERNLHFYFEPKTVTF